MNETKFHNCLKHQLRQFTTQKYFANSNLQLTLKPWEYLLTEIIPAGFPLGLENLEKWEGIFQSGKSQEILNRLEKSGKITQNTGKLWEFEINII